MRTIDDLITEIQESKPMSSYSQVEDFEKTTVYHDLQNIYSIWIDQFRESHETGASEESSDFFRGAINTLKEVKKATEHLKEVISEGEEKSSGVQ